MFAPFGLPSENRTAEWHPEPTSRGTFSLVSTCLITMGLCIWTAVHLNIPEYGKSSQQYWRKLLFVFVGLFAPELIAWTAYEQYNAAQDINRYMWKALGQKPKQSLWRRYLQWICSGSWAIKSRMEDANVDTEGLPDQLEIERQPWTPSHSHYAAMGGYPLVLSTSAKRSFPNLPPRRSLTRQLLKEFADKHPQHLLDISETQIRDKSKSSVLAKTLVCIQAAWFCMQCIVRLSQGLTISLLELNTFAHALCAFLVYMLWWSKPLDIEEPTFMQGEPIDALCVAVDYSETRVVKIKIKENLGHLYPDLGNPSAEKPVVAIFEEGRWGQTVGSLGTNQIRLNERVHGWKFSGLEVLGEKHYLDPSVAITLPSSDLEKLRMIRLAKTYSFPPSADLGVQVRIPNMPDISGLVGGLSLKPIPLRMVLGMTIAGFVYGGIHLVAWNAPFPTHTQLLLWRMSGLVLVSSGLALFPLEILAWTYAGARGNQNIDQYIGNACCLLLGLTYCTSAALVLYFPLLIALLGLYIFARAYLVVECFLNLAHLPPSVFQVPTWSQYAPHIT